MTSDVAFLPTDYAGADELIDAADLAMVYGGQDIVDKYADDPTVFVNGPGRTKILITADRDWRDYIDVIVDSVAHLGGMACVNATAVLHEGDARGVGGRDRRAALGDRLRCRLPTNARCCPSSRSQRRRRWPTTLPPGPRRRRPVLGADQVVADLGRRPCGTSAGRALLAQPDVDVLNIELPFPCVWVSPWTRERWPCSRCAARWSST